MQNGAFVVLLIALAGVDCLGRARACARNGISRATPATRSRAHLPICLRKLDGPIAVTAYATPQDARFGDLRKLIRDFIARYQRAKPDIRLEFVDPREQPKAAAAAGVQGQRRARDRVWRGGASA